MAFSSTDKNDSLIAKQQDGIHSSDCHQNKLTDSSGLVSCSLEDIKKGGLNLAKADGLPALDLTIESGRAKTTPGNSPVDSAQREDFKVKPDTSAPSETGSAIPGESILGKPENQISGKTAPTDLSQTKPGDAGTTLVGKDGSLNLSGTVSDKQPGVDEAKEFEKRFGKNPNSPEAIAWVEEHIRQQAQKEANDMKKRQEEGESGLVLSEDPGYYYAQALLMQVMMRSKNFNPNNIHWQYFHNGVQGDSEAGWQSMRGFTHEK